MTVVEVFTAARDRYARAGMNVLDAVGIIPHFLDYSDPRPARDQFQDRYGWWNPFPGFTLKEGDILSYPDDPDLEPIARIQLRDERVMIYDYGLVAIIQPDGSFEVCRMD